MSIIPNILALLRTPASGSAALRSKLAEIVEAIPAAEAEVARLASERAAKLLDASDRELEAIEKAGADARRTVDRLHAARDELARRLATAEADEAKARLDAARADAERLAIETAEKVRREYVKAARVIATLVADLDAAEAAVAAVNARLIEAGRADEVLPEVEQRALPTPEGLYEVPYRLRNAASLPPAPGFGGLGRARDAALVAGMIG